MGADTFEFVPAWCCLIVGNSGFGNFNGEVVFGYSIKGVSKYIGWEGALAYDGTDAETVAVFVSG